MPYYSFVHVPYRGVRVLISRTGYTGEMGFEFYGPADAGVLFWRDCLEHGAVPAGLGARDTLRLEVGMPLYGHELSRSRNAAESGFTRSMSTTTHYIGSGAVRAALPPARQLVGLVMDGRRSARSGDIILDGAGVEIGLVTSGSFSPSLERAIALGYMERAHNRVDTEVAVRTGRGTIPGTITGLPFYKDGSVRHPMVDAHKPEDPRRT